jgi:signal peptidase II
LSARLGRAIEPGAKALALAGVVVALDQASKAAATAAVERGHTTELLPFLSLANVRNRGIAFGVFTDASALLIGVTIVILIGVLVFVTRGGTGPRVWVSSGLLVGGALGNLTDRVRIGAVVDFVDLPIWPTFNLADAAIVAGVLCLVLLPDDKAEPQHPPGSRHNRPAPQPQARSRR